jgi:phage terminase small subunit
LSWFGTPLLQRSRLLANVNIKASVRDGRRKVSECTEITVEAVVKRIAEIVFVDPL